MNRYRIIYEDDSIIVVDKPQGMLVIQTPKKEKITLTSLLNQELDQRGIEVNAYPCHRLDRETSGIIIYAKGKRMQQLIMGEFKKKAVRKIYIAFVHGCIRKNTATLRGYIHTNSGEELAITKYRLIEKRSGFSILEIEPITGKRNQIRIQLKQLGHPLVGESVYAFRKDFRLKFKRVALHAGHIEFNHPVTNHRLSFDSPLPEDMTSFLHNYDTDYLTYNPCILGCCNSSI